VRELPSLTINVAIYFFVLHAFWNLRGRIQQGVLTTHMIDGHKEIMLLNQLMPSAKYLPARTFQATEAPNRCPQCCALQPGMTRAGRTQRHQ
jgi:hypothetical protein